MEVRDGCTLMFCYRCKKREPFLNIPIFKVYSRPLPPPLPPRPFSKIASKGVD